MRVVVAGLKGFIGTAAGRALRAAGHEVVGLARGETPTGSADTLVWAAGGREPTLDANRSVHVEAAVQAARALRGAHVVYVSTGECYGDVPLPAREDGPAGGTSIYAQAKLEGERALADVAPTTVLRVGVGYGPRQKPHMLIPQIVAALRANRVFPMTEGSQTRDFVFIDDIADAIVAAVAASPVPIVNIASGEETYVRDAARTIARALGADEALLGFGQVPLRTGEAMRYVLDVSLAARVLGWRPRISLARGAALL